MFETLIHATVDTIQTSKKMFVDTFVKHEGLAKTLNEFVDTQTNYTKQAIDASIKTGTNVMNTLKDKEFYTDAIKTAQETVKSFHTQKKGK